MTTSAIRRSVLTMTLVAAALPSVAADTASPDVSAAVRERDGLFWKAYNDCDVKAMAGFFTEDVEFYHDRGGLTAGHPSLMDTLRQSLCGNPDSRLRREAVEGTVRVFPMRKNDVVYGAILSGEHVFYVKQKDKPEFLDGRAKFMDLWTLKDGVWKMSRILSYDHGPAVR